MRGDKRMPRTVLRIRSQDHEPGGTLHTDILLGIHSNNQFGTHHAADANELFKTKGLNLNIFSSAMKINSQYMHILHFVLKVKNKTSITKKLNKLEQNDIIALTDKVNANEVFSFGRDHGHFGRILNQAVISVKIFSTSINGIPANIFIYPIIIV